MMNNEQFNAYCDTIGLPASGRSYLQRVRSSPPSRRVTSRVGNAVCRYPSKKMGFVISVESRTCELPVAYQMEYDSDVLEYYEQPESVKLVYPSISGRPAGAMHTPDFLVLRHDSVAFIEVKPEERLHYLAGLQPHRYQCKKEGGWNCPPGSRAAREVGFDYQVVSSAEINRVLTRNLDYLDDYYRDPKSALSAEGRRQVIGAVRNHPGITIANLSQNLGANYLDIIFSLIASGEIYFDMEAQPIADQGDAHVFFDKAVSDAYKIVGGADGGIPGALSSPDLGDETAAQGATKSGLLAIAGGGVGPSDPSDVPSQTNGTPSPASQALQIIQSASPEHMAIANDRHQLLNDVNLARRRNIPDRTLRRWRRQLQWAERVYRNGYIGLLPRFNSRGNPEPRLPAKVYEIAQQVIKETYMTPTRVSKRFAFGRFAIICEDTQLSCPSYAWFCNQIQNMKEYEVKLAREGKRSAYSLQCPGRPLSARNDNHGDFPWQVVHIDHTEVDIELVDEDSGIVLGRPWLTLMFDAYSRRTLCFVLSFDPPSVNSLRLLFMECVKRHSRLPSSLVLDWGKEFGSEFLETLAAMYQVKIVKRPPHHARFGSVIEREFGNLNQALFHNLQGNTQNTRNVRQLTKSVDPKRSAVWSLEELHGLLTRFCEEVHDHRLHPTIGTTPLSAYEQGMTNAGLRLSRIVELDEAFRFLMLATTSRGSARIQPGMGVKIRYFYYWCEEMRNPRWEREQVPVRYDMQDIGVAYVRMDGRWIQCRSCHYDAVKGKTEKQLGLAVETLRQQRSVIERNRNISASQLARFFESVQGEEVTRTQRMKDQARSRIVKATGEASVPALNVETKQQPTALPSSIGLPVRADNEAASSSPGPVFGDF